MNRSRRWNVPPVVVWSAALYVVLMVSTIVVCSIESTAPRPEGRDLGAAMLDSLKVGLGALIGVLSQWAHQSFGSERDRDDERDAPRAPSSSA